MFISPVLPPLPYPPQHQLAAGELCMRDHSSLSAGELCMRDQSGLGLFDPGIITSPLNAVSSVFQTFAAKKIADKQAKLEAAKIKAEREQNAREFALVQAQLQALPYERKIATQTYTLWAIAGVATVVSGVFLFAAIRAKKES